MSQDQMINFQCRRFRYRYVIPYIDLYDLFLLLSSFLNLEAQDVSWRRTVFCESKTELYQISEKSHKKLVHDIKYRFIIIYKVHLTLFFFFVKQLMEYEIK